MTLKMVSSTYVLDHPTLVDANLTQSDKDKIPGYVADASSLIEGYLEATYADPPTDPDMADDPAQNPVPQAARIVCRRMVARVFTSTPVDPTFDSYASTMGPMSHTKHVAKDVLGGGVWLTNQDKMILDSISGNEGDMINVPLYDTTPRHPSGIVNGLYQVGGFRTP